MRWKDAIRLLPEQEVTVRATMCVEEVVDMEIDKWKHNIKIMLSDGRWYSYREIK